MIHGIARVMRTAASDVVEDQRLDMTVSKALLFSFITSCPIRMHIVPLKSDEVNQGRNTIRWHKQICRGFRQLASTRMDSGGGRKNVTEENMVLDRMECAARRRRSWRISTARVNRDSSRLKHSSGVISGDRARPAAKRRIPPVRSSAPALPRPV